MKYINIKRISDSFDFWPAHFFLLFAFLSSCSTMPEQRLFSEMKSCQHTETSFHCVQVVDVYDGDTIFIHLPDQHPLFGRRMGVRIMGIDTPEIRTKNACEKKKAFEAKALLQAKIEGARRIDIIDVEADKYFRILGTVLVDGVSVADELIESKLAFAYDGGKKQERDWCDKT